MSLAHDPGPTWRHRIFVLYVVAMLLAFLLPTPPVPLAEVRLVDKLVHFLMFLGFALLFYLDRHREAWRTFLIGTAFAGGIELLQGVLPFRQGDWLDFAAGAAGAGCAALATGLKDGINERRQNRSLGEDEKGADQ